MTLFSSATSSCDCVFEHTARQDHHIQSSNEPFTGIASLNLLVRSYSVVLNQWLNDDGCTVKEPCCIYAGFVCAKPHLISNIGIGLDLRLRVSKHFPTRTQTGIRLLTLGALGELAPEGFGFARRKPEETIPEIRLVAFGHE